MSDGHDDCIFCKIAAGALGTEFVAETDNVVAFDDISPRAKVHVQVIPRRHIASARDVGGNDAALWAEMLDVANQVADKKGIGESGFRLVTNAGKDSGQEVLHLHLHVIGGEKLGPIA
jgi:histidine triad (HIT) family protein